MRKKIIVIIIFILICGSNIFADDDDREGNSYNASMGIWMKADTWELLSPVYKELYTMAFLNGFFQSGMWLSVLFNEMHTNYNSDYKMPSIDKLIPFVTFEDTIDVIIARIDSFYSLEKNKEVAFWQAMLYLYKGYIIK